MDALAPIGIWAVIVLISLGLLLMLVFGIRSLVYGKVETMTIVMLIIPLLVLIALGLVMGDWPRAGIWTVIITFVLAILSMFLTSIRGFIS